MVCDSTVFWNLMNYVWNNRICVLGRGRCFGGRVPVGACREMALVGMVTGPCTK